MHSYRIMVFKQLYSLYQCSLAFFTARFPNPTPTGLLNLWHRRLSTQPPSLHGRLVFSRSIRLLRHSIWTSPSFELERLWSRAHVLFNIADLVFHRCQVFRTSQRQEVLPRHPQRPHGLQLRQDQSGHRGRQSTRVPEDQNGLRAQPVLPKAEAVRNSGSCPQPGPLRWRPCYQGFSSINFLD